MARPSSTRRRRRSRPSRRASATPRRRAAHPPAAERRRLLTGAGASHPMTSMLHRAAGDRQFIAPFGAAAARCSGPGMFDAAPHGSSTARPRSSSAATWSTQRYHASLNDDAIFRDPLTVDDYLAARYITKPRAAPRLRLPGRLRLGGDLHHRGAGPRPRKKPVVSSRRTRFGDPRPALRGPRRHGRTTPRCTAPRSCGRAPTSRRPTSTPRSSTTASRSSCSSGSRPSASAAGRGRRLRRRGQHPPRRHRCR